MVTSLPMANGAAVVVGTEGSFGNVAVLEAVCCAGATVVAVSVKEPGVIEAKGTGWVFGVAGIVGMADGDAGK
jgi:hypothetical protein